MSNPAALYKSVLITAALCFPAGPVQLYFGGNWYSLFHSYSLGMLFGILAYCYFLLTLVLSARFHFLDRLFGHDRILHFHAAMASTAFLCVLFHLIFKLIFSVSLTLQPLLGISGLALIAFVLTGTFFYMTMGMAPQHKALVALRERVRRRVPIDYSVMKLLHNGLALAMALIAVHVALSAATGESSVRGMVMGGMAGTAVLIYVLHKFIRPLRLSLRGFTVTDVSERAPGITSVVVRGTPRFTSRLLPGQYVYVRLRAPVFSREEHPFTIAAADPCGDVTIHIKAVGDYTSRIGRLPRGSKALIDGPYGLFRPRRWDRPLLCIAGGIGITPFFSLIKAWESQPGKNDVTLVWSVRTKQDLFDDKRFDELQSREPRFTFIPIVTRDESAGRTPRRKVLLSLQSVIDGKGGKDPEVFLCGPQPMQRELFAFLRTRGVARRRMHYERFT